MSGYRVAGMARGHGLNARGTPRQRLGMLLIEDFGDDTCQDCSPAAQKRGSPLAIDADRAQLRVISDRAAPALPT